MTAKADGVHPPLIVHGLRRFEVWSDGVHVGTYHDLRRARITYLRHVRTTNQGAS